MNETTPSTIAQKSNLERKIIRRERLSLIAKNKTFLVGAAILSFWIILAIFGNFIAPRGASDQDFEYVSVSPQWKFWFGTDANGQDVLSRVILGTRLIVVMAFTATALGTILGTALGLATGYFKGKFDMVIMRLVEAVSAIPVLIIALLAIAALEGRSPTLTVIVIGFAEQRNPTLIFPGCLVVAINITFDCQCGFNHIIVGDNSILPVEECDARFINVFRKICYIEITVILNILCTDFKVVVNFFQDCTQLLVVT